jgi:hypothetical protein
VLVRRVGSNADVCVLGDGHRRVLGTLNERSSQSRLSNVAVQDGKTLSLAVVLQNEVLAYFQPVPPIWPQGTRFCAGNAAPVKTTAGLALDLQGPALRSEATLQARVVAPNLLDDPSPTWGVPDATATAAP